MMEVWLLIDAGAIRRAADNPNGQVHLALPPLNRLEGQPDPKSHLRNLLVEASELNRRRRQQFQRDILWRCARVAELIADFSPLRTLSAFADFEQRTREVMEAIPDDE